MNLTGWGGDGGGVGGGETEYSCQCSPSLSFVALVVARFVWPGSGSVVIFGR